MAFLSGSFARDDRNRFQLKSHSQFNGVVVDKPVVDKPAGMTSHDVVNRIRRIYQTKRVGHTGTLDPDATGVLVLCLGNGTRLAEYLSSSKKHYAAEFLFGVETSTQDTSGAITAQKDASGLTEERLISLLPAFRGTIVQIPPMVSARHHEGKRLYELAREGIEVVREGREIEISELALTDFQAGEKARAKFEITCSTGTYIRTLAFDIGSSAGCGGCMSGLRRTWVGESEKDGFALQESYSLDSLEALSAENQLLKTVVPLSVAVKSWKKITLPDEEIGNIRLGRSVSIGLEIAMSSEEAYPIGIMESNGELAAVGKLADGVLRPVKVLA